MKRKVKRYDEGGGVFDNIKEGLSRVFRRDEDSPKFSDLESVGGAGRRQKTIEEQIKGRPGREIEGKFTKDCTASATITKLYKPIGSIAPIG